MYDIENLVGAIDISEVSTKVAFDLLDPNNPVYVLALPGLEEPIKINGTNNEGVSIERSFSDILKALNVSAEFEIETGDPDDPEKKVKIDFAKMSDFESEQIIKKIQALSTLQQISVLAKKMANKADNVNFAKMLESPESKKEFLTFLDDLISKLGANR